MACQGSVILCANLLAEPIAKRVLPDWAERSNVSFAAAMSAMCHLLQPQRIALGLRRRAVMIVSYRLLFNSRDLDGN